MAYKDKHGNIVVAAGQLGRFYLLLWDNERFSANGRYLLDEDGTPLGLDEDLLLAPWRLLPFRFPFSARWHRETEFALDADQLAALLFSQIPETGSGQPAARSYATDVAEEVRRQLQIRLHEWAQAGRSVEGEMEPAQLARHLVDAVLPEPDPWSDVGPFLRDETVLARMNWSSTDLATSVANHSVLELVTEDGLRLYPTWQFTERGVLIGFPAALTKLAACDIDPWTLAGWFVTADDDEPPVALIRAGDQVRLQLLISDAIRRFEQ